MNNVVQKLNTWAAGLHLKKFLASYKKPIVAKTSLLIPLERLPTQSQEWLLKPFEIVYVRDFQVRKVKARLAHFYSIGPKAIVFQPNTSKKRIKLLLNEYEQTWVLYDA